MKEAECKKRGEDKKKTEIVKGVTMKKTLTESITQSKKQRMSMDEEQTNNVKCFTSDAPKNDRYKVCWKRVSLFFRLN